MRWWRHREDPRVDVDGPELRESGDVGDEELAEATREPLAGVRELGVA